MIGGRSRGRPCIHFRSWHIADFADGSSLMMSRQPVASDAQIRPAGIGLAVHDVCGFMMTGRHDVLEWRHPGNGRRRCSGAAEVTGRGPQSGRFAWHWRTDHPSVSALGKAPDWVGASQELPSAQSRGREPGCGEVALRYPARHGGMAGQAKRRAAVGGGRAGRSSQEGVRPLASDLSFNINGRGEGSDPFSAQALGREPRRPAPPHPLGRCAAARVAAVVRW